MVLSSSYRVPLPNDILKGLYILLIKDEDREILYPRFPGREACADYLLSAGVENVIFTAGISGCFLANAQLRRTYPGYDYPSIDETGTGDVFTGCMVTLLSEGVSLPEAVGAAAWAAASPSELLCAFRVWYEGFEGYGMPTREGVAAIEQGILTPTTKQRMEELEQQREDLEISILQEQIQKPPITKERLKRFYLGNNSVLFR